MVFYFWLPPQVLWNDLRGIVIKQRHWQTFWCIIHVDQATLRTGSCLLRVGSNKTIYHCFHPLPVPMAARITKYLDKYVRKVICLIYMSSFYFWSPPFSRKIRPMEWSTGNSYQAETLTNVLWYQICRSSHPEDRKLPITELKWDARTLSGRSKLPAVQPWWLNFRPLPVSRIAWHTCIIPQNVCTCLCFINIYSKTVYTPLHWCQDPDGYSG
jgi:hypothetical protein